VSHLAMLSNYVSLFPEWQDLRFLSLAIEFSTVLAAHFVVCVLALCTCIKASTASTNCDR
jgi:hypothetical protein